MEVRRRETWQSEERDGAREVFMNSAAAPTIEASIEDVKSYWNRRPCNIRHSDKPVGSKEYFDEVEARKYFIEPHIPGFAEF